VTNPDHIILKLLQLVCGRNLKSFEKKARQSPECCQQCLMGDSGRSSDSGRREGRERGRKGGGRGERRKGREERRKKGRKEERKEGRKEGGRKEGRRQGII
jgi:hypothetical protein